MKRALWMLAGAAAAAAIAGVAGGFVVVSGLYDISATDQHRAPTYWLMEIAMQRSVRARGSRIDVPPLDDPAKIERGLALYRQHCVQCHGAPGVAPEPFALGMTPNPANLAHTAREWRPADLYWVISQGIKMTGMPAWEFRIGDDDIWAIVAFLKQLPTLSPQRYRAMQAPAALSADDFGTPSHPGDADRAKRAIHQYACATCHRIPGIVGASAPVGPPLDRIGTRAVIAGVLPNTELNMVRWLRSPQQVKPHTAMPSLGMTERDARDIARYLSHLR